MGEDIWAGGRQNCGRPSFRSALFLRRQVDNTWIARPAVPGPVKRFQNIWPAPRKNPLEPLINRLHLHRTILVNPAARLDVDLLPRPERQVEYIPVAVQP